MKWEKEYINYLIENKKSIDIKLLDNYFLDNIDFDTLILSIDLTDIQSFKSFVKSKKIDELFSK
jgi:ASC-1-like (ASCH) protein